MENKQQHTPTPTWQQVLGGVYQFLFPMNSYVSTVAASQAVDALKPKPTAPLKPIGLTVPAAINKPVPKPIGLSVPAAINKPTPKPIGLTVPAAVMAAPREVATLTDNATVPAQPAVPPAPSIPAPPAATPSINSSEFSGGELTVPLRSVTTQHAYVPTYGVDSLDHQDYSLRDARRYAQQVQHGMMPILSNAEQAATNRLQARNNLALTAATASADSVALHRAMNDPFTRERAARIAQQTGVSLDLALKQAMTGALVQQGNYALANRYESSAVIPAMERENQQRIAHGLSTGADVPAMLDVYGNPYQSLGVNSVYGKPDGSVNFETSAFITNGTPNAALTMARQATSTAPLSDAFSMSAADAANARANANYRAQVAGKAAEADARAKETRMKYANEAAEAKMRGLQQQLETMARIQRMQSPTAPRSIDPTRELNALVNVARLYPDDDPKRVAIAEELARRFGINLDDVIAAGVANE